MTNSKSMDMLKTAVEALQEKKGENIRALDISDLTVIADYFVIVNGNNVNHVQALADNLTEQMYKAGYDEPKTEGYNSAAWILLDYNDIIIHIFSKEDRLFYDLERIWKDGKVIDIDNL